MGTTVDTAESRRREPLALLLLVLAAALRFTALDRQSFWLDEAWTLAFARMPFPECLFADANMPPLFVALLHLWVRVVGTGSDVLVRCLPALLGVLGCAAFWIFARALLPRRAALCALAFLALDPLQLYFSQELRSYPLLGLFITVATHCHLRELEPSAPRARSVWLALALTAGLYAHYLFGFLALAIGLHRLARLPREMNLFVRRLWPLAIAALLYLPWVLWLAEAAPPQERGYTTGLLKQIESLPLLLLLGDSAYISMPPSSIAGRLYEMACIPLFMLSATPLLVTGVLALWQRSAATRFVLFSVFLPLAGLAVLFPWIPLFTSRYLSFLSPLACFAAAAGAMWIGARSRRLAWLFTAILVALQGGSLVRYYFDPDYGRENWRGAAAWVAERSTPEARLLFEAPYVHEAFARYYRGPGSPIEVPERDPARAQVLADVRAAAPGGVFLVLSHTNRTGAASMAEWTASHALREWRHFAHSNGIEVLWLEPRRR